MTRVLRIITRLNIGGPSIQAIALSERLAARGFETRLLHGRLGVGEGDMRYLLTSRGAAPAGVGIAISRRRRWAFMAGALLLSILLPLAALVATDAFLHTRFQRTGGVNVWGYRGPIVHRKAAGEQRDVVLGGSAAFGYGVGWMEAIPARLDAKLRSAGVRASVVNLAYNNEGAYSFRFTLADYLYLDYDLAVLYEGY